MARARILKPGFFTNEILAECSGFARLLFAGLWCHSDKEGRSEYRPKRIRAEILPYDDCDIDALLGELETHQFIHRYEVDGAKYLQVLNFSKHQRPHAKEAASVIPAPPQPQPRRVRATTFPRPDTTKDQPSTNLGDVEKPLNLVTLTLLPSTPNSPQGGNGSAKVAIALFEKEFEEIFWPVVWVKDGKRPAKLAFVKARVKATLEEIMAGAERYRERLSGIDPPKPKYPQGWLNDERWTDGAIITHEIPEPRRPTGPPPPIDGG